MIFTTESIIFAVPSGSLANIAEAREKYGEFLSVRPLEPNSETVKTLLGHTDRIGAGDLRAGVLGLTVTGTTLTNGMVAFIGHFTQAFVDALGTDPLLDGCQILTEAEFQNRLPLPLP